MSFIKKLISRIIKDDNYTEIALTYVNSNDFSSNTNYFIWVDLSNFKVNIYRGYKNKWTLVQSYLCSIGTYSTPTPTGTFTIGIKGLSFGQEHGYICYYYTQFKGNYLFHSIIYNLDGSVRDPRLGKSISNGCIRLEKINAKWIYDNIPEGTKVYID